MIGSTSGSHFTSASLSRSEIHCGSLQRCRVGGMTVVFVEAKNCCTPNDVLAGALSWFRAQELLRHLSGHLHPMFSL